MSGHGQGLVAEFFGMVGMQGSIHLFAELLFDFGIFRLRLQYARPSHEDLVIFLMTDSICFERLVGSAIDVAFIEMEISGVNHDRPEAHGMAMQRVDLSRSP